jgi:Zn-dependent protease
MKNLKLFRIFNIDVQIHYSWWFIFVLLAWSLASSYFPLYFPEQDPRWYWVAAIISALLLFFSVLLHELSHSLVAKAKNIKVESITLFFFGGVAGITDEDMKPSSEFQMAVAGPLFSLILGAIFYLIHKTNGNGMVEAITFYLYQLNFILAIFNLVPAFPLDGGRAFRAILYGHYKDLKKATRIAANGGKIFAAILIGLGLFSVLTGQGGGLWFVLIGGFLYFIAGMSYNQVVIREVLNAIPAKELISKEKPLLPTMKFSEFLSKYQNKGKTTYIVQDAKFSGILDVDRVATLKKISTNITLGNISLPIHQIKTIQSNDTAYKAYKLVHEQNLAMLPIVHNNKVIGVIKQEALAIRLNWELRFK